MTPTLPSALTLIITQRFHRYLTNFKTDNTSVEISLMRCKKLFSPLTTSAKAPSTYLRWIRNYSWMIFFLQIFTASAFLWHLTKTQTSRKENPLHSRWTWPVGACVCYVLLDQIGQHFLTKNQKPENIKMSSWTIVTRLTQKMKEVVSVHWMDTSGHQMAAQN